MKRPQKWAQFFLNLSLSLRAPPLLLRSQIAPPKIPTKILLPPPFHLKLLMKKTSRMKSLILENPQALEFSPSDDPDLLFSIKLFILTLDHTTSQEGYADIRDIILGCYPESGMLSYDWVKRRVSNLSGVHTWKHNMCIDSCTAFTGLFAALENCPWCGKPCYDPEILKKSNGKKKVHQKQCTTFVRGVKPAYFLVL